MTSPGPGWEALLASDAPAVCHLQAALFTTYEPAEERLLVEHLLPTLLKLGRDPGGEGREKQLYLLELDARLRQLHERLVIVSSAARAEPMSPGEGDGGCYAWIWHRIRALTVGSRRKAVQHAKLWMLHWTGGDDGEEYLEIVVSSANLTTPAFRGQLQAAWRACVSLEPRGSDARLRSWGPLPAFLRELAVSAGDDERLQPFVALLARAECPADVTFVASVPGNHSPAELRRTPWGVAGLAVAVPEGRGKATVSVLAPYVGTWSPESLERWCARFGGEPRQLRIAWIDRGHVWARQQRWAMPEVSLRTFSGARCTLLQLPRAPSAEEVFFHADHRPGDERWSHAKIYALRRGRVSRLLVTSANFSAAAWGREGPSGALTIENFELGVCTSGELPFDELHEFDDLEVVATTSRDELAAASSLQWADATWDGATVTVRCRVTGERTIQGRVRVGSHWAALPAWTLGTDGLHITSLPWAEPRRPPSVAELVSGEETLAVPVFDSRTITDREESIPTEVDEDLVQALRDELILEQYGGRVEPEDGSPEPGDTAEVGGASTAEGEEGDADAGEEDVGGGADLESYAVPAFVLARRHLRIVDSWAARVAEVPAGQELERAWLLRDGELLREALLRRARRADGSEARGLGARLAAEEIGLRLQTLRRADAAG